MANFIEKLGLDFLVETEDHVRGLWGFIAEKGEGIVGYYGCPYLNHHFGDAQLILRVIRNDEQQRLEVVGMDTHSAGRCVWDVCFSGAKIGRKDGDILERRCVVRRNTDGGGMAVVNIVNADVLPSFDEGVQARLQMIAFPHTIEYFKDEDEYLDAQPKTEDGRSYVLADGTMFPTGLLHNRNPDNEDFEADEDLDDVMLIRGTVKGLYHGQIELDEEKENAYLRCFIDTEFGELEIVHTLEDVPEEQIQNIRVGAVVSGAFTLSGDAAIYEYEHGIIFDEDHDLAILRSTLAGASAERMRFVFSKDAVYVVGYNGQQYHGRDAIIDRLLYVQASPYERFAYNAVITDVADGGEPLRYGPGKRCIVVARDEPDQYETIAFVEIDAEGRICRLETSDDSRYRFHIEEEPSYPSPLDHLEMPESVLEPMILRGRFHGIIGDDISEENLFSDASDLKIYEDNAERMLQTRPEGAGPEQLGNLFGYLFAKAIEKTWSERQHQGDFHTHLLVRYAPGDAWNGELRSLLEEEQHRKLLRAMELGRQFYRDFAFFHHENEPHSEDYEPELMKALIAVQQLGKLYAPNCLG